MEYHKHKGAESKGKLKSHPVTQGHKDPKVQRWHNEALGKVSTPKRKTVKNEPVEQETSKRKVLCQVDSEGYISMNLDKANVKGLKLTFTRRENNKKREVNIKFDNKLCKLRSGEKLLGDRKLTFEEYN